MSFGFRTLSATLEDAPVDGTVGAATQISGNFSGSGGQHFSPLRVIVETATAVGVTETAIISVGTNSPDYDNVIRAHAVDPVEGSVETIPLWKSTFLTADSLHVRVVRPATATDLTFVAGVECLSYVFT